MRWILYLIGALVLLSVGRVLLLLVTHAVFSIVHLAILLAVVIFLVGLVRRLMVIR